MVGDVQLSFELNKAELRHLEIIFDKAPKEIRKHVRKQWRKQGKRAVKQMKRSHFSGPTSEDKLDHRTPRERVHAKGKPLKNLLAVKKLVFGRKNHFGGYVKIGFKGPYGNARQTHPLVNIYENTTGRTRHRRGGASTGSLRTKEPLTKAWNKAAYRINFAKAVEDGIDDWIKS